MDNSQTYGGALAINRVRRLTPVEFDEEVARIIRPFSNDRYVKGIHTLSHWGEWTLVDGKFTRFHWASFRRALRMRMPSLRRVIARLGIALYSHAVCCLCVLRQRWAKCALPATLRQGRNHRCKNDH